MVRTHKLTPRALITQPAARALPGATGTAVDTANRRADTSCIAGSGLSHCTSMTFRSTCSRLASRFFTGGLWLVLIVWISGASVTLGQDPAPPTHPDSGAAAATGSTAAAPPAAAQTPPTANESQPGTSPPAPAEPAETQSELTSHDSTPTFQVRANMVLVRVVIRDSKSNPVGTLTRDDFQIFDNRKPQIISSFNVVDATKHGPAPANSAAPAPAGEAAPAAPSTPDRFVAIYFDDAHGALIDLMQGRIAAQKFVATSLQPSDRVGVFTVSGQDNLDFTSDREKLRVALGNIKPRAVSTEVATECLNIDDYQAYLIVDLNNAEALSAATADTLHCFYNDDSRYLAAARIQAAAQAQASHSDAETKATYATRGLDQLIQRMSRLPGQRSIILASPGFLVLSNPQNEWSLIERAVHANVVINSLDIRGLWVPEPFGDPSNPTHMSAVTAGPESATRLEGYSRQADVLRDVANGTGGLFFQNSNDLRAGFGRLGSVPDYSYVLGFVPPAEKLDGRFHSIEVKLTNHEKYAIQARRGYYAPAHGETTAENARHDIEEAIFSDQTLDALPMELHAQFFKLDAQKARIAVLARVDTKFLPFRKADGRNLDDLTIVTVLFDNDGKYLEGKQKVLTMKLMDATREKLVQSGIRTRTTFDVAPGTYQVRLVVRDSEGKLMSAQNQTLDVQ
jgi:VWFA-related protein